MVVKLTAGLLFKDDDWVLVFLGQWKKKIAKRRAAIILQSTKPIILSMIGSK